MELHVSTMVDYNGWPLTSLSPMTAVRPLLKRGLQTIDLERSVLKKLYVPAEPSGCVVCHNSDKTVSTVAPAFGT